jgi:hypothetical protein
MLSRLGSFLKNEEGAVLVLAAAGMVAFMGLVAIVSDVGLLLLNRARLVNGVDAAALAGVSQLPAAEKAVSEANLYARANGIEPAALEVTVAPDGRSLTVAARRTVSLFLARVLGYREADVAARAVAGLEAMTGYKGVVPLGVEWEDFQYGVQYQLKNGGGGGTRGNYGALALGGKGANKYGQNLKYGYNSWLRVGDKVETEPGNMSGKTSEGVNFRVQACHHIPPCTYDNYALDCPRVVVLPVVEGILNGRSTVEVVGFAAFFLEGVGGSGNDNYVTGRFLELVLEGEGSPDQTSYGLQAGKLLE